MTVKELIEVLQGAPQDAEIYIGNADVPARLIVLTDHNPIRHLGVLAWPPALVARPVSYAVLYDETQG